MHATKTKLTLLADYTANISETPTVDDIDKKFLFVIKPEQDGSMSQDDLWRGTIHRINKISMKHRDDLFKKTVKKFDAMEKRVKKIE